MIRGLFAFLVFVSGSAATQAQECGGAIACTLEDGEYNIVLPQTPALGTVIFLHGFGGRAARVAANKGLLKVFIEEGYAVIAPQGLPFREGMKGGSWNAYSSPKRRDDVSFIQRVLADAGTRFSLPVNNTVVTGFSGGGMMTWRVACNAPDAFSAYAPIAGLLWRPLPENCAGPVRMLHTHGWSDPVVPLEGRTVGGGILTQGDLFDGLELLRRANGCEKDNPDAYSQNGDYLVRSWTSCADNGWLATAIHPGGHVIPRGWGRMVMDWHQSYLASQ